MYHMTSKNPMTSKVDVTQYEKAIQILKIHKIRGQVRGRATHEHMSEVLQMSSSQIFYVRQTR